MIYKVIGEGYTNDSYGFTKHHTELLHSTHKTEYAAMRIADALNRLSSTGSMYYKVEEERGDY